MAPQPGPVLPSVSVIIAVKNADPTLPHCLDSVLDQTGVRAEVAVIDGGSDDGTYDIIRTYSPRLSYWISEPDTGIYQAWNKGLTATSAEWVTFLGADDFYSSTDSLRTMVTAGEESLADLVVARITLVDRTDSPLRQIGERWSWNRLKKAQHIAHPGALHRRQLFRDYGIFDESYEVAADYEFLLRLYDIRAAYVSKSVLNMRATGISRTAIWKTLRETRSIQSAHPAIGRMRANKNTALALAKAYARRAVCAS